MKFQTSFHRRLEIKFIEIKDPKCMWNEVKWSEIHEISWNTWNYNVTNNKKSNNKFIVFYTKINLCRLGSLSLYIHLTKRVGSNDFWVHFWVPHDSRDRVLFWVSNKVSGRTWQGGSEGSNRATRDMTTYFMCGIHRPSIQSGTCTKLGGVQSSIKSVIFIISSVVERREEGISWKGVLFIHIPKK